MKRPFLFGAALVAASVLFRPAAAPAEEKKLDAPGTVMVKAKAKPADAWKEYPTRTLEAVQGFTPGSAVRLDRFGGWLDHKLEARGRFYATRVGKRWWLVDPDGGLFLHVGVVSVAPGKTSLAALKERFGSSEGWADGTARMLREHGFNGAGAWSDVKLLRGAPTRVVYTCIWNLTSGFGKSKKLTHTQPGHTGYVNDCIPVFHPDFEAYCDQQAKALAELKDDPYCLGHFSDNEMPCPRNLLDKSLALDPQNPDLAPGYKAAYEWLKARKGKEPAAADITDEDRDAFRGYVFARYYEVTTRAIRKYDPNHLCLGSRLYGSEKGCPAVWAAAGKYLDVVSVNYYGAWTPSLRTLHDWEKWSGKPVIITEWYTKGADSGFANNTGAGWIVETQADRGRFYQNYTLALLESDVCVGWHWFKYLDNDPNDLSTDPSNRDSNKGIVTIKYEGYAPLLERMGALNREVYPLTAFFDKGGER